MLRRGADVDSDLRAFDPPAADGAVISARIARLPERLRALVQRAGDALESGDARAAQRALASALAVAPGQADVLRLHALLQAQVGNFQAAVANFQASLRAAPDDALGYWQFARACEDADDIGAATRLREQAVRQLPASPLAWSDLGDQLARQQRPEQALPALLRATQLAPDYAPAQMKLGEVLLTLGRIDEAAAALRRAIAAEPAFGAAWLGLADIRTIPVTGDEMARMAALLHGRAIHADDRTAIGFALGKVYEDHGRYAEAFEVLVEANARRRREVGAWNATEFLARIQLIQAVFAAPHARADDATLGSQVVFIAGLPRSGTTLVEQILASHSQVQGAGELGTLAQVLAEESAHRQRRYPEWVPDAGVADWLRLGRRYLALTGQYRGSCPRFTDKLPNNWQAIGAIRAMLPGAHIVLCRRDPLENCWSCFKQVFPSGWECTYDLRDLGVFWRAFDQTAAWWGAREPGHVREQDHAALVDKPEAEIRDLLAFCDLPFEPACLAFHQTRRSVHTLSASQVRQPLQRRAHVAAAYGTLLDPLRSALGLQPGSGVKP